MSNTDRKRCTGSDSDDEPIAKLKRKPDDADAANPQDSIDSSSSTSSSGSNITVVIKGRSQERQGIGVVNRSPSRPNCLPSVGTLFVPRITVSSPEGVTQLLLPAVQPYAPPADAPSVTFLLRSGSHSDTDSACDEDEERDTFGVVTDEHGVERNPEEERFMRERLVQQLRHIVRHGLPDLTRERLISEHYPGVAYPEFRSVPQEDDNLEQRQFSSIVAALVQVAFEVMADDSQDQELLTSVVDAARLAADLQHAASITRRRRTQFSLSSRTLFRGIVIVIFLIICILMTFCLVI